MTWRIGSVPHLNVQPLVYGLTEPVTFCTPARLADAMYRREFDVGLVPAAEVLLHDQYDVVDGIAVVSHGPVLSAFLAHRVPVDRIRRVAVDPASRSTAWLTRVILKYRFGLEPEFYPRSNGATLSEHEAMMVFGDEAVGCAGTEGFRTAVDLGAAWTEWTGLPFVYAIWATQRDLGERGGPLRQMLRDAKANGLAHMDEVISESSGATPAIRREYLTRYIQYDLGESEKAGLRRFQQLLAEMNLVERHELRYV